ncbi:MAG: ankyrin repeat domain-containing protein [Planctomycetota bacterium]
MPDHVVLSERLPRRVVAIRLTASDDLPAIPGQQDGERIAPIGVLFDPEMRRANVERLEQQLREAHAHAGIDPCGPGADAWQNDETFLRKLPWLRSPAQAMEQLFSVCGHPSDVTLFPVLVFDGDDADWREVVDGCRRALDRTFDNRLHHAAQQGDLESVRRAIRDGWPLNDLDPELGWAPLHHAAQDGQLRALDLLLAAGTPVDHCEEHGQTALHVAIEANHAQAVRILLEAAADPDRTDDWGRTGWDRADELGPRGSELRRVLEALRPRP